MSGGSSGVLADLVGRIGPLSMSISPTCVSTSVFLLRMPPTPFTGEGPGLPLSGGAAVHVGLSPRLCYSLLRLTRTALTMFYRNRLSQALRLPRFVIRSIVFTLLVYNSSLGLHGLPPPRHAPFCTTCICHCRARHIQRLAARSGCTPVRALHRTPFSTYMALHFVCGHLPAPPPAVPSRTTSHVPTRSDVLRRVPDNPRRLVHLPP
mmetsp:Transcript_1702/g.4913  ORF Transcript_1702/g.4913 Transcript_1702/m.4913 type:complete len:207 (-) Transcript_1702:2018-2638(-)